MWRFLVMKKTESTYSSEQSSEGTDEASPSLMGQLTNVKTGYARLAIFLLAMNCAFTGYIVYSLSKAHDTATAETTQQTSPAAQTSGQDSQAGGENSVAQPTNKD